MKDTITSMALIAAVMLLFAVGAGFAANDTLPEKLTLQCTGNSKSMQFYPARDRSPGMTRRGRLPSSQRRRASIGLSIAIRWQYPLHENKVKEASANGERAA